MNEQWSIVLADDQMLFLDALAAVLTGLGHSVVAAVTNWQQAVIEVRNRRPRLCIADPALAGDTPTADLRELVNASTDTLCVALTAEVGPDRLNAALGAGMSAFVHKNRRMETLLDVLDRVCAGEVAIEGFFLQPAATPSTELLADQARLTAHLTPRELECLALLVMGRPTPAIAADLDVSLTTVRTHIQAILTKLGVHSRLEAASLASRNHIVQERVEALMRRPESLPNTA